MSRLTDRAWRPHRFIVQNVAPGNTFELAWGELSIGLIETMIIVVESNVNCQATLNLNGVAVSSVGFPGTGGAILISNAVYNQIEIPVWYQDVLQATFEAGGETANAAFIVTGRVSGWTGDYPIDGLG